MEIISSVVKQRVDWIDYLKGIGIIFVVIGHLYLPPDIRKFIYAFHMPLFFFASGLTFSPTKYSNTISFIKKKAISLLIPYVVINLATFPSWIYFNKILGHSTISLDTLIYGIFYSNSDSVTLLNGPTWFITTLFLTELTLFFMSKLLNDDMNSLIISSFSLAVMGYVVSIGYNDIIRPWHFASVPVAVFYMSLGYWFSRKYKQDGYELLKDGIKWYWIAGLFALGTVSQYVNGAVSFGGNKYKSFDLTLVASISLIFSIVFICMKLPKLNVLKRIGSTSLIILGLHSTIKYLLWDLFPSTRLHYISSFKGIILLFLALIPLTFIIDKYFPFMVGKKSDKKINIIGAFAYGALTVVMVILYLF